jgi:hypothetical protein
MTWGDEFDRYEAAVSRFVPCPVRRRRIDWFVRLRLHLLGVSLCLLRLLERRAPTA